MKSLSRGGVIAIIITLLAFGASACGSSPRTGAQKCADRSGTVVSTQANGSVTCDYRTQRRRCQSSNEQIVQDSATKTRKSRVTCRVTFTSDAGATSS